MERSAASRVSRNGRTLAIWLGALLAYDFEEVPLHTAYCLAVLEHMHDLKGVTFYDSAYHVLALQSKGLYVTADAAYVKRRKRE